jgi:tRNA U34 5-methylaminomethyl-2-thiouridine-forming methyltransferase MnmC
MQDQQAALAWRAGDVPVSTRFDDPYFSLENGLEETRHVFLAGNGLPARFSSGFHVAELGFGTGLNFLATVQAWRQAAVPGVLHFTSFEAYPMGRAAQRRALSRFADLPVEALEGAPDIRLTIIEGDARTTLPHWTGRADAWFLDGFSPAKNPELWQPDLMAQVAQHTAPGGTAATYTAAGFVRRGLAAAGFEVTRAPGFGRKRHMSVARLP